MEGPEDHLGQREEKKGEKARHIGLEKLKKIFVWKETYFHETVVSTKKQMIAESVRWYVSGTPPINEVSTITKVNDDAGDWLDADGSWIR